MKQHTTKPFVYSNPEWGKDDPKEIALAHITDSSKILDVGCGVGGFGKWLIKNKGCSVDGIDGHPDAVIEAQKYLTSASQVDLNDLKSVRKFTKGTRYDFITFIDVLEHCHHPQELLEIFQQALSPSGRIIVSLPNIAHYSTRRNILKGRFDYADSGLMDRTHVAFYTRKTSAQLLENAGLEILFTGHTSPRRGVLSWLSKLDPTLTAIQFVMVARKKV